MSDQRLERLRVDPFFREAVLSDNDWLRAALAAAEAERERLREALSLIATRQFTAALDAREMRGIAREALAGGAGDEFQRDNARRDNLHLGEIDRLAGGAGE
jgi:hypothetical protein